MAQRMLDVLDVTSRLGRSRAWFYQHRQELNALGFPRPHPVIRKWDAVQVEDWLNGQMGLTTSKAPANDMDAAFGL